MSGRKRPNPDIWMWIRRDARIRWAKALLIPLRVLFLLLTPPHPLELEAAGPGTRSPCDGGRNYQDPSV
ncbi:hypothetical protein BV898_01864 [Hypsibius exemplaris]|uniref:Uncharacterized protein n=1 Tax=Hypsibius exemplaris TaxID=2072580 RepID=A0A1W0X9W3_HYPEX|nr:hypothetical protein BV898_01864 [Hypsibius exemplaris]